MTKIYTLLLALLISLPTLANDRISLSYQRIDDGSCGDVVGNILSATYSHQSDGFDVRGSVRSAPSGGDCREDGLSYSIDVERRFLLGESGFSGLAKFLADERSTTAPYALVDAMGKVLLRPDGQASNPLILPAGRAQTIGAILGLSKTHAGASFDIGFNVVPVDWADGSSGRTFHGAIDYTSDFGSGTLGFGIGVDIGNDTFGETYVEYRFSLAGGLGAELRFGHAFGLNALDAGVPPTATFAGLPAVVSGAPQDTATTFAFGLSLEL